jgi:hypothetical protein
LTGLPRRSETARAAACARSHSARAPADAAAATRGPRARSGKALWRGHGHETHRSPSVSGWSLSLPPKQQLPRDDFLGAPSSAMAEDGAGEWLAREDPPDDDARR